MEVDLVNDLVGTPSVDQVQPDVLPTENDNNLQESENTVIPENNTEVTEPVKQPDIDDPFIKAYLKAKEKETFDFDEFMQIQNNRYNIDKLDPNTGLKEYYQSIMDGEKRKYTDETIEKYINNLSDIEKDKEWSSVKQNKLKEYDEFYDRKDQDYKQQLTQYYTEAQKETDDFVNALILAKEKVTDIAGIPHTKEVSGKFQEKFKELMSIDKESEPITIVPRHVHKLLNDNDLLYNLLYIHERMKDGGLTEYIEKMRNEKVDNTLNKMGVNPSSKGGSMTKGVTPPAPSDFI